MNIEEAHSLYDGLGVFPLETSQYICAHIQDHLRGNEIGMGEHKLTRAVEELMSNSTERMCNGWNNFVKIFGEEFARNYCEPFRHALRDAHV